MVAARRATDWLVAGVLLAAAGCGQQNGGEDAAPVAGATAIPVAPPNASGATFPGQPTPTVPTFPDPQQMPKIPDQPLDPFDPGPLVPPAPSGKPKGTTL